MGFGWYHRARLLQSGATPHAKSTHPIAVCAPQLATLVPARSGVADRASADHLDHGDRQATGPQPVLAERSDRGVTSTHHRHQHLAVLSGTEHRRTS